MNKLKFLILSLLVSINSFAQVEKTSELYKTIKKNDSLLFIVGFNTCNIAQFENLLNEKFEFYHDQGGITSSKKDFIATIKDGLCKKEYKPRRQLIDSTMAVFPLYKDGILYGAIQTASHKFYANKVNRPEYLSSVAQFTHLWLLQNGKWQFSSGLSYDHKDFKNPID